ncbi:MAG: 5-formyltetrahydrofolate cyclo-ligase [Candidatus Diapherotrites archaeon]
MKQKLREKIMALRDAHAHEDITFKSHEIKKRLFNLSEFKKAKNVMFYAAMKGEVKTRAMIQETLAMGKKVIVPITDFEKQEISISEIKSFTELEEKKCGLYEPKKEFFREFDPKKVDFIIVPGLAFDCEGDRIGYGFGFYDKFLLKIKPTIPTVGLAFEFQIVYEIPREKHDVPIHKIVTEKRIIDTKQGKCVV